MLDTTGDSAPRVKIEVSYVDGPFSDIGYINVSVDDKRLFQCGEDIPVARVVQLLTALGISAMIGEVLN